MKTEVYIMTEKEKTQMQIEIEQREFLKKEILSLVSGHTLRSILLALDDVKQEVQKNASYRRVQDS